MTEQPDFIVDIQDRLNDLKLDADTAREVGEKEQAESLDRQVASLESELTLATGGGEMSQTALDAEQRKWEKEQAGLSVFDVSDADEYLPPAEQRALASAAKWLAKDDERQDKIEAEMFTTDDAGDAGAAVDAAAVDAEPEE